ncbi:MAG: dockerin type I repeat-containing protein [Ruminococcus sp.]
MKKMTFKLGALALIIVLAIASTVSAGAAQTNSEAVSTYSSDFKLLSSTVDLSDNQIYFSRYNTPSNSIYLGSFTDENYNKYSVKFSELMSGGKILSLPNNQKYKFSLRYDLGSSGGGSSDGTYRSYSNTGGTYRKVRVKLSTFLNSEYDSKFASDGSVTNTDSTYGSHTFRFGDVDITSDGSKYYSGMCVRSGAAITAVTPNSKGEIEFYLDTAIGSGANVCTDFYIIYKYNDGRTSYIGGGGSTGSPLHALRFGDADSSCYVNVSDATKIQSAIAGECSLNNLQTFVSDVNLDNNISIKDVTCIQKYLAGLDY